MTELRERATVKRNIPVVDAVQEINPELRDIELDLEKRMLFSNAAQRRPAAERKLFQNAAQRLSSILRSVSAV
jgi:hypothetical protein